MNESEKEYCEREYCERYEEELRHDLHYVDDIATKYLCRCPKKYVLLMHFLLKNVEYHANSDTWCRGAWFEVTRRELRLHVNRGKFKRMIQGLVNDGVIACKRGKRGNMYKIL